MDDLLGSILSEPSGAAVDRTASDSLDDDWLRIDWTTVLPTALRSGVATPSPVETILVRDRLVYVKRDDQLRLTGSQLSGNKARKMLSLALLPDQAFPECIVSYGGPQSNAMLALAATVNFRNRKRGFDASDDADADIARTVNENDGSNENRKFRFVYYTKKLPRFLRNQPRGNLFRAISLGMELVELPHREYDRLFGGDYGGSVIPPPSLPPPVPGGRTLYVPQGGACEMAQLGTSQLAREIVDFWSVAGRGRPLSVLVPGGTCSTALFLHCAVTTLLRDDQRLYPNLDVEVVVIPCVGDEGYALRQMTTLNAVLEREPNDVPRILLPDTDREVRESHSGGASYFTFGEPHREVLDVWSEMKDDHQLVLDLLYGAPSWAVLFRHMRHEGGSGATTTINSPIASRALMYVHSGGLEGITSQLLRYKYKNLVDTEEIQLPGRSK